MADSSSLQSKSLHHVAYATRDPEATYEFYSQKLGLPLAHTENHLQGDGYFRHFFFDMGNDDYLAFFEVNNLGEEADYRTDVSIAAGLPIWVNHIAFRLDTEEELVQMIARLHEKGLDQLQEIDHGWCRSVYLVDPNGIMVEFCVTTDAEAFTQTEEEALRLMRLPPDAIGPGSTKEVSSASRV